MNNNINNNMNSNINSNIKLNIILFFGLPGAGKSTLGNLIEEKLKIKYVSVGEIYRNIENDIVRTYDDSIKFLLNSVEANMYIPDDYNQNYIIIDGLKIHNNIQKNFFKVLMNTYNISNIFFFNFVDLNVYLNMSIEDDLYIEHFNLLKNRLINRNRINENINIIEKRININFDRFKKIIIFINNINNNISKYDKKNKKNGLTKEYNKPINILTLNTLDSLYNNYNIFKTQLNM